MAEMEWPAASPDLNQTENVRQIMRNSARKYHTLESYNRENVDGFSSELYRLVDMQRRIATRGSD